MKVGSAAGFAMVFALLVAAIIWNLGTWYLGLPSSSSHTLIGSIIGVGLMNQLMHSGSEGTSGVDWGQATTVGEALLFSPLVGFVGAALLLLAMKLVIRQPQLYAEPKGAAPPPLWIRSLLIFTCTAVSFAHGSNDGQKGMGLIMLILIGTVPTAYALNRAVDESRVPGLHRGLRTTPSRPLTRRGGRRRRARRPAEVLQRFVGTREFSRRRCVPPWPRSPARSRTTCAPTGRSPRCRPTSSGTSATTCTSLSETLPRRRQVQGRPPFAGDTSRRLAAYKKQLDNATKFIPTWVKVAVALALGLGTMVGWKRIVITVGEKIGKTHLTYGQGAVGRTGRRRRRSALADIYGLPVSTTHVLSSGVAGTMAANGSGLQWGTIRNLLAAWVLTLPASIALAGALYWLFNTLFGGG